MVLPSMRQRPRLEPALRQLHLLEARAKGGRRRIASATRRVILQTNMDQTGENVPAVNTTVSLSNTKTHLGFDARHTIAGSAHRQPAAETASSLAGSRYGDGSPRDTSHGRSGREWRAPPDL